MKKILLTVSVLLTVLISLQAQESEIYTKSGKAIRGYDPVSYFLEGKPVEGQENYTCNWKNATWYFSTQQHLDLFKSNPTKYAPQYGGYCAYGLSNGYKAPIDEEAWTIDNGKLYLNYSISIREKWNKNRRERIEQADRNWPSVKNKR